MRRTSIALLIVAACGDNIDLRNSYMWDDRRVLCSESLDDLTYSIDWDSVARRLGEAEHAGAALIFHVHKPTVTISLDGLDRLLTEADAHHLVPVTFRELDAATPREGALALAFDDNAPDEWLLARDVLQRHHARVTFFVSRYAKLMSAEQSEIQILANDGYDIEPHTVNHLHARDYVAAHGLDAYLADEVLPSFQVLIDAGYSAPSAFAYPFGEHSAEIDTAILEYVPKVRTTMGECPW